MFTPGELTSRQAADLNRLADEVRRLGNIRVAGNANLVRGPAGVVIEVPGTNSSTPAAGGGRLIESAVHVTARSAGPPVTFTVRRVDRSGGGGALVETSPTVEYTGVYEAQGREVVVDASPTVTHEFPLYEDGDGNYYIQLDQYAAGNAATPLVGIVSNTTQYFKGQKLFKNDVQVNYDQDAFIFYFGTQDPASAFTVYSGNTTGDVLPLRIYDGQVVIGTEPTTKSGYAIGGATNLFINGQLVCADNFSVSTSDVAIADTAETTIVPFNDTLNTSSGCIISAGGKYGGGSLGLANEPGSSNAAVFPCYSSEYYTAGTGTTPGVRGDTWSGTYSDSPGGADFQVWPDSKTISTDFQIYLPTSGQSIATEAKPFQVTKVTIGGSDYWMVHVVP